MAELVITKIKGILIVRIMSIVAIIFGVAAGKFKKT